MAMKIQVMVFWVVTLCSNLVGGHDLNLLASYFITHYQVNFIYIFSAMSHLLCNHIHPAIKAACNILVHFLFSTEVIHLP